MLDFIAVFVAQKSAEAILKAKECVDKKPEAALKDALKTFSFELLYLETTHVCKDEASAAVFASRKRDMSLQR